MDVVSARMLQALNDSNLDAALTLLCEGFPARGKDFWQTAMSRLKANDGNRLAEVPIGYLMHSGNVPTGVVLTPARVQKLDDGTDQRVVNLSSWYVRSHDRWRGPMMLQQLLRMENVAFTDLTPTVPVQEMLKAFGFVPINGGVSLSFLPLACMKRAGRARVVTLSDPAADQIAVATRQMLARYEQFDCLTGVLIDGDDHVPLVFKRVRGRRVPLAILLYSEDNKAVYRNFAAIARYLIRARIFVLALDILPGCQIPGIARKKRGRKFARGVTTSNRTDYLGSELSLFDW